MRVAIAEISKTESEINECDDSEEKSAIRKALAAPIRLRDAIKAGKRCICKCSKQVVCLLKFTECLKTIRAASTAGPNLSSNHFSTTFRVSPDQIVHETFLPYPTLSPINFNNVKT